MTTTKKEKTMKRFTAVFAVVLALFAPLAAHAACTQALATSAKGNFLAGAIRASDTFKIAAYTSSATWDASTAQYSGSNEIAGSGNYPTGGFTLATPTLGTSTTFYWLTFADEVNSDITFAAASNCVVIYDSTTHASECTASGVPFPCCTGTTAGCAGDMVLGVWTHTSVQPAAGTLTYDFPVAAAGTAIIQISRAEPSWLDPTMFAAENGFDQLLAWNRLQARDAIADIAMSAGATAGLSGAGAEGAAQ
jgi:hypothetical protein